MRKLHPLTAGRNALGSATQLGTMGFFLGVAAASIDVVPAWSPVVLALVGGLVGVAYGVARYLAFAYELDGSTLNITSGVFLRQNREIPLGRVQNVDVRRSILQRVLGLAVVRFETAGGGETEAVLQVVSAEEADRLRGDLARRKQGSGEGATAGPTPREPNPEAGGGERTVGADEGERAVDDGDEPAAASGAPAEDSGASEPGRADEVTPPGGAAEAPRTIDETAGQAGATDGAADEAGQPGGPAEEVGVAGSRAAGTGQSPVAGEAAAAGEPRAEVLFELSPRDLLLLSGLTFRLRTVPLVLFALPFGESLIRGAVRRLAVGGGPNAVELGLVLGGLLALVLAAWLLSAVVTFLSYFDFRLTRVGDELRYERGLVQRYSGTIPLAKVQSLTVTENVLMRRFGYAALTVQTAGYAAGSRSSEGGLVSRLAGADVPSAVPLADREAVRSFVAAFEGVDDLEVAQPPPRARRRYLGRYSLVVLGVTALLGGVDRFVYDLGGAWSVPLVLLAVTPVAAQLAWRHRGYRTGDRHLLTRTGFWRRTTQVVPYYRVQTVVVVRTVFQRRWGLASVVADTAASGSLLGREAIAQDRDDGTAEGLHDHLRERLRAEVSRRRSE